MTQQRKTPKVRRAESLSYVLPSQLKPGDRVVTDTDEVEVIREVTKGMYKGHLMLHFKSKGFTNVSSNTLVAIVRRVR